MERLTNWLTFYFPQRNTVQKGFHVFKTTSFIACNWSVALFKNKNAILSVLLELFEQNLLILKIKIRDLQCSNADIS